MNKHLHHVHHVHHKHIAALGVVSWITCDGDRNSACHFYPDHESPTWEDGWTEQERLEHGYPHEECIYVLTSQMWDCAELCVPHEESVRNGPIIPSWSGYCLVWKYADTEEVESEEN